MSDFAFSMPTWLAYFLAFSAPALVIGALWLLRHVVRRASAWADRKVDEALAPPVSVLDDFAAMGEQADNVVWGAWDGRPRLTVIDDGDAA